MPVISFKVTNEEHAAVLRLADSQGQSPGVLCRELALAGTDVAVSRPRIGRQIANRDVLRQLLGEISRQGSNLNQLARRTNAGAEHAAVARDLAAMKDAYQASLTALTAALGVGSNP